MSDFEEWKKVSKGRLCDYSEMTYSLLEKARETVSRASGTSQNIAKILTIHFFSLLLTLDNTPLG